MMTIELNPFWIVCGIIFVISIFIGFCVHRLVIIPTLYANFPNPPWLNISELNWTMEKPSISKNLTNLEEQIYLGKIASYSYMNEMWKQYKITLFTYIRYWIYYFPKTKFIKLELPYYKL